LYACFERRVFERRNQNVKKEGRRAGFFDYSYYPLNILPNILPLPLSKQQGIKNKKNGTNKGGK
jgi:hypothetical protein